VHLCLDTGSSHKWLIALTFLPSTKFNQFQILQMQQDKAGYLWFQCQLPGVLRNMQSRKRKRRASISSSILSQIGDGNAIHAPSPPPPHPTNNPNMQAAYSTAAIPFNIPNFVNKILYLKSPNTAANKQARQQFVCEILTRYMLSVVVYNEQNFKQSKWPSDRAL